MNIQHDDISPRANIASVPPSPIANKEPIAIRQSSRARKGTWRDGPVASRPKPTESSTSEGADVTAFGEPSRQEGGTTVANAEIVSSRAFKRREKARQSYQAMAQYNPEVTVTSTNNCLQLIVNLTKNIDGRKLIYTVKGSCRKANNIRIHSARKKKHKSKSDPDKFTLAQAMRRQDWDKFEEAMNAEDQQLLEDNVLGEETSFKELTANANLIGSMYIFAIKRNKSTGKIDKYKARLVALGNQQRIGSYDRITSSTARGKSIKLLMALQAKTQAKSMVLDVKGAYLKSKIQNWDKVKLFIRLPNGRIHRLNKYIYGLKQSGAEWESNVTNLLERHQYESCFDSDGKL